MTTPETAAERIARLRALDTVCHPPPSYRPEDTAWLLAVAEAAQEWSAARAAVAAVTKLRAGPAETQWPAESAHSRFADALTGLQAALDGGGREEPFIDRMRDQRDPFDDPITRRVK